MVTELGFLSSCLTYSGGYYCGSCQWSANGIRDSSISQSCEVLISDRSGRELSHLMRQIVPRESSIQGEQLKTSEVCLYWYDYDCSMAGSYSITIVACTIGQAPLHRFAPAPCKISLTLTERASKLLRRPLRYRTMDNILLQLSPSLLVLSSAASSLLISRYQSSF